MRYWLADKGYDPKMGARPMARLIQESLKRPLAEELRFGRLAHGGRVMAEIGPKDEKPVFVIEGRDKPEKPATEAEIVEV